MKKSEFIPFLQEISKTLDNEQIKYDIPYVYINKEEFNYIQILIIDTVQTFDINRLFNVSQIKEKHGIIYSIIDDFPVNFIKTNINNWNYSFYYYNWNILHVLFDVLVSSFNLKYTSSGLKYDYNGAEIFITSNMVDIFDFFELKFKMINGGFLSIENIFMFIFSSPYFNYNNYTIEKFKEKDAMFKHNEEYYKYFIRSMPKSIGYSKTIEEQIGLIDSFFNGCDFYTKLIKIQIKNEK